MSTTENKRKFRKKPNKFDTKNKFGVKKRPREKLLEEIDELQKLYKQVEASDVEEFTDFPLSQKTQEGLATAGYTKPTEIQRESVVLALQGNDILGAAKTGSGKTLAFLIPVLECLFRQKWSSFDGLGALIITPTRELAYQIFEVLRKIGKNHDFSAGLVIGGKHLREEAEQIPKTNIVICTPGRLLQHMDETVFFKADNLQMLVLDEADRILDLGFQQSMNAIIENLPPSRQTLLFSATQTRSVKDLARLSLKDPMYVSVHEHSQHSTPAQLEQSYLVCALEDKMSLLWSFLNNPSHTKSKILVFMQSCKQVRFFYEVLRRLCPGKSVFALHGAMQQLKRVASYQQFCRKQSAVLLATDVAARGLDFPAVHWVVQMDCPEDANTYIHRAGRTARYEENGESLLVLLPSEEEGMLAQLHEKKIPINMIKANPKKLWSIQGKVESLLAADVQLKDFAKGAFMSYVKSVHLMSDKKVFDVKALDTDKYALSLGLAIPPRIRFLQKDEKRRKEHESEKKLAKEVDAIFAKAAAVDKKEAARLAQEAAVEKKAAAKLARLKKKEAANGTKNEEEDKESEDEESDSEDEVEEGKEKESDSEHEEGEDQSSEESSSSDNEESEEEPIKGNESEQRAFDIGDNDLDDILKVKKYNAVIPTLDEEEDEEEEKEEDKSVKDKSNKAKKTVEKPQSKYQVAKLLQKKNIKVNTKVVFNEEGEEVVNKHVKSTVDSDESDDEGGLNIADARRRMQKADKVDREIDRERVKKMHREQKQKEKDKRRKKSKDKDEDEEGGHGEAMLPSGSEDEADLGNALDFLPDPDKIYGDKEGSEESEDSSEAGSQDESKDESDEDSSDDEDSRPPKKRLKVGQAESDSDEEQLGTKMSLQDEEALALQLLS